MAKWSTCFDVVVGFLFDAFLCFAFGPFVQNEKNNKINSWILKQIHLLFYNPLQVIWWRILVLLQLNNQFFILLIYLGWLNTKIFGYTVFLLNDFLAGEFWHQLNIGWGQNLFVVWYSTSLDTVIHSFLTQDLNNFRKIFFPEYPYDNSMGRNIFIFLWAPLNEQNIFWVFICIVSCKGQLLHFPKVVHIKN